MKANILMLFSLIILLGSCQNETSNKESKSTQVNSSKAEIDSAKLLRHVVLFKFNATATSDIIKNIEQEFIGLSNKISEIHSFEWGTNNSPEGLDKGLTHCFFVTFLTEEDRAAYLPHPEHQKFVKLIEPYIEDVTVVDYWTE